MRPSVVSDSTVITPGRPVIREEVVRFSEQVSRPHIQNVGIQSRITPGGRHPTIIEEPILHQPTHLAPSHQGPGPVLNNQGILWREDFSHGKEVTYQRGDETITSWEDVEILYLDPRSQIASELLGQAIESEPVHVATQATYDISPDYFQHQSSRVQPQINLPIQNQQTYLSRPIGHQALTRPQTAPRVGRQQVYAPNYGT